MTFMAMMSVCKLSTTVVQTVISLTLQNGNRGRYYSLTIATNKTVSCRDSLRYILLLSGRAGIIVCLSFSSLR